MKGRAALGLKRPELEIAALVQDGRLIDLFGARPQEEPAPGDIWAAKVTRLFPNQGAAMLELGGHKAYLPAAKGLAAGDAVKVEIQRPALGAKAAQATLKLSYVGAFLAHTPQELGVNVSRKISDQTRREALRASLAAYADAGGFILRTRAAEQSAEALSQAARALIKQAQQIEAAPLRPPRRLRKGAGPQERAARDWGVDAFDEAGFEALGIAEQLEKLLQPRAALKSGWMALERTEALIAVDVNSSDAKSALEVNLHAAAQLPLQLRLRGWAGMAVVDFAPMREVDRPKIESAFKKNADATLRIVGWGPLGLLELTRRYDRSPISAFWPPHSHRKTPDA